VRGEAKLLVVFVGTSTSKNPYCWQIDCALF